MKQTCSILSTYTADTMGVPSALYELGGMVVMNDPSGCNSTYNTHDEPRWYDIPSMIYISALTETDALLGNDRKIIDSVVEAAKKLHPKFIAVCGTPIPMMVGTDFKALALCIEKESGIPALGFSTTGMHSYISGVSMALCGIAERFCPDAGVLSYKSSSEYSVDTGKPRVSVVPTGLSVNILGVTPLDFSVTGNVGALKDVFVDNGIGVQSIWAMQSSWEELMSSGRASVNVVVSRSGKELARVLKRKYGIPCVTGLPVGNRQTEELIALVKKAAKTGADISIEPCPSGGNRYVVGEGIAAQAIANELYGLTNRPVTVIDPVDTVDEDFLMGRLSSAEIVVADPMYEAIIGKNSRFIAWPHEGYSGRIYRNLIPLIMGKAGTEWLSHALPKEMQL